MSLLFVKPCILWFMLGYTKVEHFCVKDAYLTDDWLNGKEQTNKVTFAVTNISKD